MKITKTKLPQSQYRIILEVDEKTLSVYQKKAVEKLSKEVSISGFRKGHVPEKKVREMFGEEAILSEAADLCLPKVLTEAIVQEKLSPLVRPEVEIQSLTPLVFQATVTVFPKVELKKWEDVEIKKKEVVIEKKEIDEVLDNLCERFMDRKPVERASKKGDFTEIDFAGKTPDGVPLDGTTSKCHPLILGSGNFIPGFEEEIIGMKKNEEKSFEITFPKDYQAKHMAGKVVVFDVKVVSVSEQIKPKINDDLAEKVLGKKVTVQEMRDEIKNMLTEKGEQETRSERENLLLEEWEKQATVEMPEILITEELENMLRVMKDRAQTSGILWEQYLQNMKKTEEDFRKEMRSDAEKRAKQRIILNTIVETANIKDDDKGIEEEAKEMLHAQEHAHGHGHGEQHHHEVKKDSENWRQAAHKWRIEKLFDRFLGERFSPKKEKEEAKK